jgi:hypothetical protein
MSKPKFYQAELRPVSDSELTQITRGQPIDERIEPCPDCGGTTWWLLPKESSAVRTGGKPYCECINCGYATHL